ncbi:hypothetical protein [Aestuariibacter salexigens]|uniref:hypothetical protein n=1 Tax=Aestuariibacter salexigens TaxID=226010 RepID=UPI0004106187|nr:hypothetical protein [Aestuariibacter salexigens]
MKLRSLLGKTTLAVAMSASLVMAPAALAQKHIKQNLSQLVNKADSILTGSVVSVTDGFDNRQRPYTEVTVKVESDVKGKVDHDGLYTFRQFGLTEPRSMGNGKVYLGVSPQGFASWTEGEHIIAFMNPEMGGLTSTVGLEQGKFVIQNGKVINELGNQGLFDDMDTSALTAEQQNLLTTPGAVDAIAFLQLVDSLAEVK